MNFVVDNTRAENYAKTAYHDYDLQLDTNSICSTASCFSWHYGSEENCIRANTILS
jgi:hypothetical protein